MWDICLRTEDTSAIKADTIPGAGDDAAGKEAENERSYRGTLDGRGNTAIRRCERLRKRGCYSRTQGGPLGRRHACGGRRRGRRGSTLGTRRGLTALGI